MSTRKIQSCSPRRTKAERTIRSRDKSKGRFASTSSRRRASASRCAAGKFLTSKKSISTVDGGSTVCAGSCPRNRVRKASCRATTVSIACCSACGSSAPRNRDAMGILYSGLSGSNWLKNQRRCCSSDNGTGLSPLRRGIAFSPPLLELLEPLRNHLASKACLAEESPGGWAVEAVFASVLTRLFRLCELCWALRRKVAMECKTQKARRGGSIIL